ncbi:hypothetical protein OH492_20605 [Vibrio chagasii]|nr:hypothetical protein [Vibrio chagasii]
MSLPSVGTNLTAKQAIIDELAEAGILWEALEDEVGKDMDPFDMICHVVYDQPALTVKNVSDNVKKRNYFTNNACA